LKFTMLYDARYDVDRETAQAGEAAPSKYIQIYIILCHYNNYINIFKRFENWIMLIIPISDVYDQVYSVAEPRFLKVGGANKTFFSY